MQYLFFLNQKFQGSNLLLRLYRLVLVRPGRKPKLLVFSYTGSNIEYQSHPSDNTFPTFLLSQHCADLNDINLFSTQDNSFGHFQNTVGVLLFIFTLQEILHTEMQNSVMDILVIQLRRRKERFLFPNRENN